MPASGRAVVVGGTVVTDYGAFRADLVLDGERISAITADAAAVAADVRIEAAGLLVLPGGIDAHTHFWEPADELLEGFATGGAAAAAGGITTVVEMPQASPTTVTAEQLRAKRDRVGETAIVDTALWAGVIGAPDQAPEELAALAAEGAAAYKSFMASSSRSFPAVDDAKLLAAMVAIAPTGLPYGIHAENDALVAAGVAAMRAAGRRDPLAHAESRPPLVETLAVGTVLALAEATGCWVHICHVASAAALRLVAEARARGVRVTCETCPQYLVLDTEDLRRLAGFARCAPALREPEEVAAIWLHVLDETVDLICSDHCGYTAASKEPGREDIFAAPLGLPGVQTLLPAFYDAAVVARGMDPSRFVRQIATNPAKIFGLYPRKGTIAVGGDADLVLLDPARRWEVRDADALHRQRWTPYAGKTLTGRVVRTLRRGETVYDDATTGGARVPSAPGSGRFLPRGYGGG
jgi:allantoinase